MCSPIQQCDEKGVFGGGIVGAVAVDVVVAIVGADVGSCFRFFCFHLGTKYPRFVRVKVTHHMWCTINHYRMIFWIIIFYPRNHN